LPLPSVKQIAIEVERNEHENLLLAVLYESLFLVVEVAAMPLGLQSIVQPTAVGFPVHADWKYP
jgi:hypothetical protein